MFGLPELFGQLPIYAVLLALGVAPVLATHDELVPAGATDLEQAA